MCEAIRTAYAVREGNQYIRRINVELAPMSVEDFKMLKNEKIGTYVCFQETYDPILYGTTIRQEQKKPIMKTDLPFSTGPWKPGERRGPGGTFRPC